MALAQPEQGGVLQGQIDPRSGPLRGTLATTACMETLQVGYLHAVAAAAGCSLSQPFPTTASTGTSATVRPNTSSTTKSPSRCS